MRKIIIIVAAVIAATPAHARRYSCPHGQILIVHAGKCVSRARASVIKRHVSIRRHRVVEEPPPPPPRRNPKLTYVPVIETPPPPSPPPPPPLSLSSQCGDTITSIPFVIRESRMGMPSSRWGL